MTKSYPINARLDADDLAKLSAAAAAQGRTLSGMIRHIVAKWLKENPDYD